MHWLAARYLIKLSHKAQQANYQLAEKHYLNPKTWPPRSTPNVTLLIENLKTRNSPNRLFSADPDYSTQLKPPSPLATAPHGKLWFPMKKSEVSANPTKTRAILNNWI
jgi:hypothetical protein